MLSITTAWIIPLLQASAGLVPTMLITAGVLVALMVGWAFAIRPQFAARRAQAGAAAPVPGGGVPGGGVPGGSSFAADDGGGGGGGAGGVARPASAVAGDGYVAPLVTRDEDRSAEL